ncbi:hypothetical protein DYB25_007734 [Aphanomyces astaci]|uniref:Uncharacterized protein n=1 Tax=Aphanomyces astaci TaxID=112090 RepID=A0A397BYA0_APHAT|nr:hypothetical protein DYB25_007734 [Aphanomyces astaci]RHY63254.1 hypothetical protein DYB30_004412 [Aphanomyces astaci]
MWVDDADRSSGVTFKARSHFTRAVSVLRIANRRGSRASSSEGMVEVVHATDGKDKRSMAGSPSVKRMASMRQRQMLDGVPRASVVPGVYHIPWIWKTFLIDAALERPTMQQNSWGRRELKRFILDILIEKIKLDELEIDEDVVSDLSVFVCDYLTTKLQNRSFQLQQLVNGLQKHIEDPRVSFFAAACGVKQLLRRGVLHSCLRSLSHLLFGELRQFILAFNRFRGANQDFVGIDQFVKIVTTVTRHGVSVRDCRLIFYDTGKEMIDLNTILRLMQEYDLRISLSHPKVMLDEADFDCIRQCLGVSSVKPKIDKQMASLHQTDETKRDLAYHVQAVEDSLAYLRSGIDTPSMNSTWETFRSSIARYFLHPSCTRELSLSSSLCVLCEVCKQL